MNLEAIRRRIREKYQPAALVISGEPPRMTLTREYFDVCISDLEMCLEELDRLYRDAAEFDPIFAGA